MDYAYLNGKIVPAHKAVVSIFDRGFVLGDGLFESLRAVDYAPEYLPKHYQRLKKSASRLKLSLNVSLAEMGKIIEKLCKKSQKKDTGVRITLTRGRYDGGLSIAKNNPVTLVISLIPSPSKNLSIYRVGVPVAISTINKEAASGLDSSVKTTNYLANIFAKNEADKQNCYEAILLGKNGEIAELSTSSFFCVIKNELYTPPLNAGILPGITRNVVLSLGKKAKMQIFEKPIKLRKIPQMQEAFLTSSIRGVVPITKIGSKVIGDGIPGERTQQLIKLYQQNCLLSRRAFQRIS